MTNFIKNDCDLKFCKAIANLEKHLEYDDKYINKGNLEVSGIDYHQDVKIGGEGPSETFRYTVSAEKEGVVRDAVEIAYKCYQAWVKYFTDNQLEFKHVDIL